MDCGCRLPHVPSTPSGESPLLAWPPFPCCNPPRFPKGPEDNNNKPPPDQPVTQGNQCRSQLQNHTKTPDYSRPFFSLPTSRRRLCFVSTRIQFSLAPKATHPTIRRPPHLVSSLLLFECQSPVSQLSSPHPRPLRPSGALQGQERDKL